MGMDCETDAMFTERQQKFISFEHQLNKLFKCHPSVRANIVLPLQLIVIQELPYYIAQSILTSTITLMSGMYSKTSWKTSPRSPNRAENRICNLGQKVSLQLPVVVMSDMGGGCTLFQGEVDFHSPSLLQLAHWGTQRSLHLVLTHHWI